MKFDIHIKTINNMQFNIELVKLFHYNTFYS